MQDLKKGAVRSATVHEGAGQQPRHGDVAVFDFELLPAGAADNVVVAAVERLLAGKGTLHAAALGKGVRVPRAWELVLQGTPAAVLRGGPLCRSALRSDPICPDMQNAGVVRAWQQLLWNIATAMHTCMRAPA